MPPGFVQVPSFKSYPSRGRSYRPTGTDAMTTSARLFGDVQGADPVAVGMIPATAMIVASFTRLRLARWTSLGRIFGFDVDHFYPELTGFTRIAAAAVSLARKNAKASLVPCGGLRYVFSLAELCLKFSDRLARRTSLHAVLARTRNSRLPTIVGKANFALNLRGHRAT